MRKVRVLFAPDYRAGNPYQRLLAEALAGHGVEVDCLSSYRRGLPLFRGIAAAAPDVVHLHWPEAYFARRGDRLDQLRVARYRLDLRLAASRVPIVVTAHNLLPHNRATEAGVFRNMRATLHRAEAIFVHSQASRAKLAQIFDVADERIAVIPFGDHAVTLGPPIPHETARATLALPADQKICLIFGTVSPYKGIKEVVEAWSRSRIPHRLVVAGPVLYSDYAKQLEDAAEGNAAIELHISPRWLDDEALRTWLSAADCAIFNYLDIFTSGAAALARSYGLPILLPNRATTVDLGEPHPTVLRFESVDIDLPHVVEWALAMRPDYELARGWREQTSWARVAEATAPVYSRVANALKS